MIKSVEIQENQKLKLKEHEIDKIKEILNTNDLPIKVFEDGIIFNEYTVGSFRIYDKIININSRNYSINLSTIFEMIMYINGVNMSNLTFGFGATHDGSANVLPRSFIQVVRELISFGLTGDLIKNKRQDMNIEGEIIVEEFHKKYIPIYGVTFSQRKHDLNIEANQIIKSALLSLKRVVDNSMIDSELSDLLNYFLDIEKFKGSVDDIINVKNTFFSANKWYEEALELSLIILDDLKYSFSEGDYEWYSFLFNSNDLFEKYTRKLISELIELPVSKWDNPRKFGVLKYKNSKSYKSFIPDILINYNENTNTSLAVIDAKNKRFYPNKSNLSELVSNPDLYQLLFYMRSLSSKYGALIYPTDVDTEPVNLELIDGENKKIILCGINMQDNFNSRKNKLKNDLEIFLLNKI